MPRNYWMVVQTPENFEISRERGFKVHGLGARQRRRAQRMGPDDRVLFYISGARRWAAIATITSRYFEDRSPVWKSNVTRRREDYPYRVKLSPSVVLDEDDYIDGLLLGPRLEYVKRWAPERWHLAFIDTLHLLPQRDFRLIEGEMKRVLRERRKSRGQESRDGDRRDDEGNGEEHEAVGDDGASLGEEAESATASA